MTVSRTTRKRRAKRGHAALRRDADQLDDALVKLGGFDLEIYWYNRRIVDSIEGLTENKTASRAQIARWSGGPMLYRHGFRVLPFGDPDDDWISLDKRAFGSSGFKLNRQQVLWKDSDRDAAPISQRTDQSRRFGSVRSIRCPDAAGDVGCSRWSSATLSTKSINRRNCSSVRKSWKTTRFFGRRRP